MPGVTVFRGAGPATAESSFQGNDLSQKLYAVIHGPGLSVSHVFSSRPYRLRKGTRHPRRALARSTLPVASAAAVEPRSGRVCGQGR
jgi:hypothetical protein